MCLILDSRDQISKSNKTTGSSVYSLDAKRSKFNENSGYNTFEEEQEEEYCSGSNV